MTRLSHLFFAAFALAMFVSTQPASARRAPPPPNPPPPGGALQWVPAANGRVPARAVVGGQEPGRQLYVCRARHRGGVHPGKLVGSNCNIGWGGREILVPNYEVLTTRRPRRIRWVAASGGQIPPRAVVGGQERGRQLYVCRGRHRGGVHPGKVVGSNCNIGYGGREVLIPNYEVMTLQPGRRPQPQPQPQPQVALRPNGRPLHGAAQLQPGFLPDPSLSNGMAGGPIDARAAVGAQCRGFITARPSFVLTTRRRFRTLRALVSAQGDTTLVAQLPNGQFVCDDDGGEGANPLLDLSRGGAGRIAIWVGTYAAGRQVQYTLGLTEYGHLTASTLTGQPATGPGPASQPHTQPQPPPPPQPQQALRPNGRPLNGAVQLAPGFMPDPALSTGVAGGPINVQTAVGGQCRGYVTARPSFVVTSTRRFRLLRALVSAQGDTTLLAQLPNGRFVCDDDGGEGNNPMLGLARGGAGRIAIWVGTYGPGRQVQYTLGLTEYDHLTASTLTGQPATGPGPASQPHSQPQPGPGRGALQWVPAANGSIPAGAVIGGQETGRQLYVCRARHRGGMHPGKVVGRNCNIGYGGREVLIANYEVLTTTRPRRIQWVGTSGGRLPAGAVVGGQEPGRQLYVCRARHAGGVHPGKVVGTNCNIGYGGREILVPNYQVMVLR